MSGVEFFCPSCSQRLKCAPGAVSKRIRCGRCGNVFKPVEVIDRETAIPALPVDDEGEQGNTILAGSRPSAERAPAAAEPRKETVLFGSPGDKASPRARSEP